MGFWDKIVGILKRKDNAELCETTKKELDGKYRSYFNNVNPINKDELKVEEPRLLNFLSNFSLIIESIYSDLKLIWINPKNMKKTNPEKPVLYDGIVELPTKFKSIIEKKIKEYEKELKEVEAELGPFVKNDELYKKIKEEFEDKVKEEIENLKKQMEESYNQIKDKIDEEICKDIEDVLNEGKDLLDLFASLKEEPIKEGDNTSRLGVLRLLQSVAKYFNLVKEVGKKLGNKNFDDKISNDSALRTVKEKLRALQNLILKYLEDVENYAKDIKDNNNSRSVLDEVIEYFVRAQTAVFLISDFDEVDRNRLIKLFIENRNKTYERLEDNVKQELKTIFKNNGIEDENTIKEYWNNYVLDVEFEKFLFTEQKYVMIKVPA